MSAKSELAQAVNEFLGAIGYGNWEDDVDAVQATFRPGCRRSSEQLGTSNFKSLAKALVAYYKQAPLEALDRIVDKCEMDEATGEGVKVIRRGAGGSGVRELSRVIAVVGPNRSGTSCVGGILHHLGVPMGLSWPPPRPDNPLGFFEDHRLLDIYNKSFYGMWDGRHKNIFSDRVGVLRNWRLVRSGEGRVIGGKHPSMSLMVPEMNEAWNDWKAIVTVRPAMDSARSMHPGRRNPTLARRQAPRTQKVMQKRDDDLCRLHVPVLRISYVDLLANTRDFVEQIIAFIPLSPSKAAVANAVAHVDPKLNHFSTVG